jgi:hypothetical protein
MESADGNYVKALSEADKTFISQKVFDGLVPTSCEYQFSSKVMLDNKMLSIMLAPSLNIAVFSAFLSESTSAEMFSRDEWGRKFVQPKTRFLTILFSSINYLFVTGEI